MPALSKSRKTAFALGCAGMMFAAAAYSARRRTRQPQPSVRSVPDNVVPKRRATPSATEHIPALGTSNAGSTAVNPPAKVREALALVLSAAWEQFAGWKKKAFFIALLASAAMPVAVLLSHQDQPNAPLTVAPLQFLPPVTQGTPVPVRKAGIGISVSLARPLETTQGGFFVVLQNFGSTPAVQTFVTDYVAIEELDRLSGEHDAPSQRPLAVGTLLPGDTHSIEVGFKTSAEGIRSIAAGHVRVVNYAVVSYEDMYHARHVAHACFYWHGGMAAPLACEEPGTAE